MAQAEDCNSILWINKENITAASVLLAQQVTMPPMPEALPAESATAVYTAYRAWCLARQEWTEAVMTIAGNQNGDGPACRTAEKAEIVAQIAMLESAPDNENDIAALAAFLWHEDPPDGVPGSVEFAEGMKSPSRRAILAIWRRAACAGGYPIQGYVRAAS